MRRRVILLGFMMMFAAIRAIGAETGGLKLDVMGEASAGAKAVADIYEGGGRRVAQVAPGQTVALAPGTYKLVLPIVGGKITKDSIRIEAGRTHTVLITTVA